MCLDYKPKKYETVEERPAHARTIEFLRREMAPYFFDEEIIYALWHRLNGCPDEAKSYEDSFHARLKAMSDLMSKITATATTI